ncbi:uncharacterized protein LOC129575176 [Sitodiplosis mosellana]|uniref:uncharacterized protein LOC129575176 n=1 Tax=Sitodiplosis mosellana TaxID=263140 RepID=UPI00244535C8|nr:uncharacterized protein LOC129575176 [Sitodiplosis mosellana]
MLTRRGKRIYEYLTNTNEEEPNSESSECVPPPKKKKVPKILDGQFYEIISIDEEDRVIAKCTECLEIKKGNLKSTGNFKTHYKIHGSRLKDLDEYLKNKTFVMPETSNSKQSDIRDVLPAVSTDKISSKLLDLVVDGNLSFNVAQLPSLQALLETVSGRKIMLPSRRKFMSTLNEKFQSMKTGLKELLAQQLYLCITCDVWSSRGQSYLGVTVHFLDESLESNNHRQSHVLAFKRLFGRQTYIQLAQKLDEIFEDYNIDIEKVTNIVTDGGSAFCKMFRKFGTDPDAEISEDYDEDDGDCDDDSDDLHRNEPDGDGTNSETQNPNIISLGDTVYMRNETGELFASDILDFDSQNQTPTSSEGYFGGNSPQLQITLPPQRRCFSHMLNLVSNSFDELLPPLAKEAMNAVYEKLRSLWNKTHRSSHSKSICKQILGCVLRTPCETRWNSKFDAIAQIHDINKLETVQPEGTKVNVLISQLRKEVKSAALLQNLTSTDIVVIAEYVKVMGPVARALDVLQGEHNCSQGFILPVLTSMKHAIEEYRTNSPIGSDFKATMLKVIVGSDRNHGELNSKNIGRFEKYFEFTEQNKELILASLTVPKFKADFICSDEDFMSAKRLLVAECNKFIDVRPTLTAEPELNEEQDDFFVSFASRRLARSTSLESEIDSEVSRYLADPEGNYSMLNKYPTIRSIYFRYNTTLSSSGAVERLFSQSLLIFTPRRNRISDEHFEQSLLLKYNRKLIKE